MTNKKPKALVGDPLEVPCPFQVLAPNSGDFYHKIASITQDDEQPSMLANQGDKPVKFNGGKYYETPNQSLDIDHETIHLIWASYHTPPRPPTWRRVAALPADMSDTRRRIHIACLVTAEDIMEDQDRDLLGQSYDPYIWSALLEKELRDEHGLTVEATEAMLRLTRLYHRLWRDDRLERRTDRHMEYDNVWIKRQRDAHPG